MNQALSALLQITKHLNCIRAENARYLEDLSALVDESIERDYLAKAENFQQELLKNDLSVSILLDSATKLKSYSGDNNNFSGKENRLKLSQLKRDTEKLSHHLTRLKKYFDGQIKTGV